MAGVHLLSDDSFRCDGRKPNELRQIHCKLGVYKQSDGSAYIELGNTKVLATVYGPHEVTFLAWVLAGVQTARINRYTVAEA